MKYNPELIGIRIKESRLSKDITMKELSEIVGVADSKPVYQCAFYSIYNGFVY